MPLKSLPRPGVYPFWFWNGDQSEDEITRQTALFAQTGCRGVVLHARRGNRTPYLSDRWLALCRHACARCRALGLKVWLYDEEGYPSGNAGMRIQQMRPDLVQKRLTFAYETTSSANPAFAAFDPNTFRRLNESALPLGTPALRFHLVPYPRHVDTFAPDAARLFLELTHERYAKALGDFLGDPVEAVYTDDESYLCCGADGLAWSPFLADAWREKYGTDPVDALPLLVEELPGHEAARLRYHELAESLFLSNFIRPQQDWCDRHGLAYVGHLCGDEGNLSNSIKNYGLSQPYLLLEDIPSIDSYLCDLSDHSYLRNGYNSAETSHGVVAGDRRTFPCLLPFLHAGSIARIFKGHELFSSEVLTFTGWEAPVSFIDTQILFELAMGVNLLTPHAFYYTIGGGTRHDCPPSYFLQQPYYPLLDDLHRKWTRLAELLREGDPAGDTLVLSPNSTLSARRARDFRVSWDFGPCFEARRESPDNRLGQFERDLIGTALDLLRRHVAFELLEESLFLEHAALLPDGGLRVGHRTFRTLVLPGSLPWSDDLRRLLDRFVASGGTVRGGCGAVRPSHAEIEPTVDLDASMEEVLVRARGDRAFLLNLSGRDLPFSYRRDKPFSLYDPLSDSVVFTGVSLPDGAVLRAGSACMVVPAVFEAARISFEDSVFAPVDRWEALACDSVVPTRPNAFSVSSE